MGRRRRVVATADAYANIAATNDLIAFSNQYGLPRTTSRAAAYVSDEAKDAPIFTAANTVFLAAAGDAPGTSFRSVLSIVVAVGGANTPASRGWDVCTSVGTPRGTGGK
jgi:hypothetical protein